jgi:lysine/ornithine N-monooxygenase
MTTRFVVLLAVLLVVLPATAQDQFDEATRATAAACVEHLRQEQLPPCVLALQRQVLQLQAIVRDRGRRLEALEEAVSVIAGNQIAARALAHCHDSQPECEALLQKR